MQLWLAIAMIFSTGCQAFSSAFFLRSGAPSPSDGNFLPLYCLFLAATLPLLFPNTASTVELFVPSISIT